MITIAAGAAGCGRGGGPRSPAPLEIRLEPSVAAQQWYRSRSACGQGPYELELPVAGARWGEEFELRVHTPRRIQVQAVVLADGAEVERGGGVFTASGAVDGRADNARCVADARERLTLGRTGSGGAGEPGTPGTPGTPIAPPPATGTAPPPAAATPLELDASLVTSSIMVARFGWRDGVPAGGRPATIRIRFWSIEPNDLDGVLFGIARIEWRPNVGDAAYEAHLAAVAAAEAEARRRREDEQRRQDEAWRQRQAANPAAPPRPVQVDVEAELAAERARRRAAETARQRRAIAAALEAERRARRQEFCAGHPEDRGCWGAGGLAIHLELERHRAARASYCAGAPEDARCWTADERRRRTQVWDERIRVAVAPPRQPDGPPPAALDEVAPPRLSAHAEWRPGYWHWTGATWFWIGGLWRVPDSDIVAETTTVAPAAPPPLPVETPPPPPVQVAIWVPGFWQWSGASWVWVAGSWQLRPAARTTWRAAEWRPRGNVHVLIPGGWIAVGAGAR